ncbi:MAG TPA: hypothetical protein VGF48_18550 [Thermoanaerobaculia bacterium]|jgi:hypothetical protein
MPEHLDYQNDDLFNPETHHESSDVPTRPLFWAMVILVVSGVVTHLVLLFMFKTMIKGERGTGEPPRTALQRPATADVPQAQPLLQPFPKKDQEGNDVYPNRNTPVTDLEDMRRAEEQHLTSYGYVDRERGVVRIPIDRAKELVLTRLPGRPGQTPAPMQVPPPAGQTMPPSAGQTMPPSAGQTMSPQQAAPSTVPDTGSAAPPATTPATTTTGGQRP